MLYAVGTHIDLSYMNETGLKPVTEIVRDGRPRLYEAGTTFAFLKMAGGMIVTKITEPSIALRVSVGA